VVPYTVGGAYCGGSGKGLPWRLALLGACHYGINDGKCHCDGQRNENGQRSEVSKWKTTGLTPLIGHLIWKH
jgi:hypothetical protein